MTLAGLPRRTGEEALPPSRLPATNGKQGQTKHDHSDGCRDSWTRICVEQQAEHKDHAAQQQDPDGPNLAALFLGHEVRLVPLASAKIRQRR